MITRLKYFHGTGYQPGSNRPRDLMVAVSVGSSQVTEEILRSFESEKIEDLAGTYGDRNAGSPIEVDRLEVETTKTNVVVSITPHDYRRP